MYVVIHCQKSANDFVKIQDLFQSYILCRDFKHLLYILRKSATYYGKASITKWTSQRYFSKQWIKENCEPGKTFNSDFMIEIENSRGQVNTFIVIHSKSIKF